MLRVLVISVDVPKTLPLCFRYLPTHLLDRKSVVRLCQTRKPYDDRRGRRRKEAKGSSHSLRERD